MDEWTGFTDGQWAVDSVFREMVVVFYLDFSSLVWKAGLALEFLPSSIYDWDDWMDTQEKKSNKNSHQKFGGMLCYDGI